MAKEISSGNSSLPLHEVLEAEFVALHGELPPDYPSSSERDTRLKALWAAVHGLKEKRAALCISGGGIRSATFGLGILQGLARCGLLDKFHYLSTVGGGGYIGSWLSAWIKNDPDGIRGVVTELRRRPDSTLEPEPRPIRRLREFSNYVAPKPGLTSVDFWTLIAAYLRDIFLNWLVLISWLAAAMMIPRLYLAAINLEPNWSTWTPSVARQWDIGLTILLIIGFALIAVATAYAIIDVPSTGNARLPQRRFLTFYQLPLLLASLILAEWWALFRNIHGSESFRPTDWLLKFVAFTVASYSSGGLLSMIVLSLRKHKARPGRFIVSIFRLGTTLLSAALAGLCLWTIDTRIFSAPAANALNYVCFAAALILAVLLLVNVLSAGLASWVTEDEDREWWGRTAAWSLITISSWIVFNVIVLWGTEAITAMLGNDLDVVLEQLKANPVAKALVAAFGGVTGIVAALVALRSRVAKKLGAEAGFQLPLLIAAAVFFVLLSIIISWLVLLLGSQPQVQWVAEELLGQNHYQGQHFGAFFLSGVTLLFGIAMGLFINTNKFSLHAIYRNRLIRAFLAAPRSTRRPHLFTGFDPADNIALRELPPEKPLHVISAALDLMRGEQLAWQERKAESFTMSRLHCGCLNIGYRPSAEYGDGITLGTAMAISGAAANPNMGFHSSALVGFLLTLFNGRLGCWLGNPGPAGARTWRQGGPRYFVGPLFYEAIGNTTDRYKYVNLFDGGHFENLGLYEMVLRRCHYIIVSDASEDPKFSFADLGEAIRKIRIDFGIPIEFGPMTIYPRSQIRALKGRPGHNCAIGRIRYSVVDGADAADGVIVYIKPACYGDEPRDIYEYYKRNETFPHESTSDQFFSESQFESYRMLGAYTMEKLCTDCGGDFRCFVRDILKRHIEMEAPEWLAKLIDASENENKV